MPTILRIRGYRFYFFPNDHEPKHIHVTEGGGHPDLEIKIHLLPIEVVRVRGFTRSDVSKILAIVQIYQEFLIEAWEAYFES